MRISKIFEELYSGSRITLSFPTEESFNSFYSQLRTSKSRYESKYKSIFGDSLTDGQVVRVDKIEIVDGYSSELQYVFYIDKPKEICKTQFKILSVEKIIDEQGK